MLLKYSVRILYYDGTSAEWAALLTQAKSILKGTDAAVHFTD